jgi:hypothetical protein
VDVVVAGKGGQQQQQHRNFLTQAIKTYPTPADYTGSDLSSEWGEDDTSGGSGGKGTTSRGGASASSRSADERRNRSERKTSISTKKY